MTKAEALKIVLSCAEDYKQNLVNRSLLFVYLDENKDSDTIETIFTASNFLHMTGLKFKVDNKANHFFNLCIDKRLTVDDFEFASNGTTPLKLQVLPFLVKRNLSAKMLGTFSGNNYLLMTDKLIGSTIGCMGFIKSEANNLYVPNTVLYGDIRKNISENRRILITYSKSVADDKYSEIVYTAKKYDFSSLVLCDRYKYLPLPS